MQAAVAVVDVAVQPLAVQVQVAEVLEVQQQVQVMQDKMVLQEQPILAAAVAVLQDQAQNQLVQVPAVQETIQYFQL